MTRETSTKHNTGIEWTHIPGFKGETWNPVVGCSVSSPGCKNCYAMSMAARLEAMRVAHYAGLTKKVNGKAVWTGKVALAPDKTLAKPLRWNKPRAIFVNSMGDLFHPAVPDNWIDGVMAVAALCPQHIFMVLTKYPERMRGYMGAVMADAAASAQPGWPGRVENSAEDIARKLGWDHDILRTSAYEALYDGALRNVWLGTSIEDQQRADERRPHLKALADQGWTTIVSYEPALEVVDCTGWEFVRQIISGGESGSGARPNHPDCHRGARDFCAAHGIAYHFKQWGSWAPEDDFGDDEPILRQMVGNERNAHRIHYFNDTTMLRVGKKKAGHLLDGKAHHEWPETSQ